MAIKDILVNGSLAELRKNAQEVGKLRKENRFQEFLKYLASLGMETNEATEYWNAVDDSMGWVVTDDDRKIAEECGILLDAQKCPRNLLLYRIVELMFPALLRITMKTIDHHAVILEKRWEYAGPHKRNVMMLSFPSASRPVKDRTAIKKRKRRVRRYYDGYY